VTSLERATGYVPLSIRNGSPTVRALWARGIDDESARHAAWLENNGAIRRLGPLGWWARGAGWCPTARVLLHALKRHGHVVIYREADGAS
jgi:hypothetical protein